MTVANRLEVCFTYIMHIMAFILLAPIILIGVLFFGWNR